MTIHIHSLSSSTRQNNENNEGCDKLDDNKITILGFGSLLSENSSRLTFPDLTNFRLARVPNYRRVFAHPASIFFQRGIANLEKLQMSSLSIEPCEGHPGFVASVFEVPAQDMMQDGVPSRAFLEREEEFLIVNVPYIPLNDNNNGSSDNNYDDDDDDDDNDAEEPVSTGTLPKGIVCQRSTDEAYIKRWGEERFRKHFQQYGIDTIWHWKEDSGLLPCSVYLRHCYLAAKGMGSECFDSFLDETFLVDRKTTIRQYLQENPSVLEQLPPPELESRYSG